MQSGENMKSNAEMLIESPAITEEYREQLQNHQKAGTLESLGDLTRNGSEGNPELLRHNLQGGGGVEIIRSAHNATAGGADDRV